MPLEFTGKNVLITGATGALGTALSVRFIEEGATVIAGFRGDLSRFNALSSRLGETDRARIVPLQCDLRDAAAANAAVRDIVARFRTIDVLVNNAAVNESCPFTMMEPEAWESIIDTNLSAVWRITSQAALPMMAQRGGVIINISSVLATELGRGSAAYAAAKAALNRFTQVAAQELGKKGVRINAVAPGLLDTGMADGLQPEAEAQALARTPLGRKGTVNDVVEAVLFLASSRATYITGQILTVDGGISCG
jgi:3-oxoacyl-[acyl-carrier protein] reductase